MVRWRITYGRRYLFTEQDTENGYRRKNDKENYTYDDVRDEFVCDECR